VNDLMILSINANANICVCFFAAEYADETAGGSWVSNHRQQP